MNNLIQFPARDTFEYNVLRFNNFEKHLREVDKYEEADLIAITAALYENGEIDVKWQTNGEPVFLAL
tara:strand:+ start:110 stop:310 length:201 start_codon:yes stop_codon:yes gene_type:complete